MSYKFKVVHNESGKIVANVTLDTLGRNSFRDSVPDKYQTDDYILVPVR